MFQKDIMTPSPTVKTEAADIYHRNCYNHEYITTRWQNPDDQNPNFHHREIFQISHWKVYITVHSTGGNERIMDKDASGR